MPQPIDGQDTADASAGCESTARIACEVNGEVRPSAAGTHRNGRLAAIVGIPFRQGAGGCQRRTLSRCESILLTVQTAMIQDTNLRSKVPHQECDDYHQRCNDYRERSACSFLKPPMTPQKFVQGIQQHIREREEKDREQIRAAQAHHATGAIAKRRGRVGDQIAEEGRQHTRGYQRKQVDQVGLATPVRLYCLEPSLDDSPQVLTYLSGLPRRAASYLQETRARLRRPWRCA